MKVKIKIMDKNTINRTGVFTHSDTDPHCRDFVSPPTALRRRLGKKEACVLQWKGRL